MANQTTTSAVYDTVTDIAFRPAAVAAPCPDAFAEFYAETVGALGGYAYQLVGDPEIAADIVQEAFTRLLSRWVGVRKPRPYLFHVVTNLARDAWSSRQRREQIVQGLVDNRPEFTQPACDPSVWDAVARLPERYREVVLLHYYADLPLADVAVAIRRPLGTVKRLVAEARDRLAASLGDGS